MGHAVGVRTLKAQLSEYLRRVDAGMTVEITDRGRPIARLMPAAQGPRERALALRDAGELHWNGKKLSPQRPRQRNRGPRTVADIVSELRE
ncbi:MAG: type II toxin-antitoxin system prevent-host-death family antitoxin [Luteitalea sp.]|nr:type II toxin-antitoxin system prevent-host-death family antitoxin [Luteitalea sp.]